MRTNILFREFSNGVLHLFYPRLCLACDGAYRMQGDVLCLNCNATLPAVNYHVYAENPFTIRFWGRLPLNAGATMYLFTKGSKVQHLLHNLKYQGRKEIGVELGKKFGRALRISPHFSGVDAIIPVPLHEHKLWLRGYNQSACFGAGLSEGMGLPHWPNELRRIAYTETQTKKSRIERLENVEDVFEVTEPELLKGKHILLVDDVLTTGSTLEACAKKILEVPGCRVSMATIAMAYHL